LESFQENVSGKIRKYYRATQKGLDELQNVKKYLKELVNEIVVEEKNE
jgi:DNA-binding PadR family transcriptional regulator